MIHHSTHLREKKNIIERKYDDATGVDAVAKFGCDL